MKHLLVAAIVVAVTAAETAEYCAEMPCADGAGCYTFDQECDGTDDCADGSDESPDYCGGGGEETTTSTTTTTTTAAAGGGGGGTAPSGCGAHDAKYPPQLSIAGDTVSAVASIVGGKEAAPHSYPFMVHFKGHGCGGSIIGPRWVLTAAHCVTRDGENLSSGPDTAEPFTLLVGAHSKSSSGKEYEVELIVFHDKYTGNVCNGVGHDIALVKTKVPIEYNDKVQPICLPAASDDFHTDNVNVVAIGWGDQKSGAGNYPDKLKQVVVQTQSTLCKSASSYGTGGHNPTLEVCAGAAGKDSCQNDSGGPMFGARGGKYVQIGVVSCGKGCAEANYPGVYTHVPSYISWIKQKTGM